MVQEEKPTESVQPPRSKGSEGMWLKCNRCREIVYRKEVDRNSKVCPKCEYHFPISVTERIGLLIDLGTFKEWDAELEAQDPLTFQDTKSYRDRMPGSSRRDRPEGCPRHRRRHGRGAPCGALCLRFQLYGR